MFLRVGELFSYNNILELSKIYDGGGTRGQKPRSKVNWQTDSQNVLFAIKITNTMINKETVKRQISIKIETIAGMETTL